MLTVFMLFAACTVFTVFTVFTSRRLSQSRPRRSRSRCLDFPALRRLKLGGVAVGRDREREGERERGREGERERGREGERERGREGERERGREGERERGREGERGSHFGSSRGEEPAPKPRLESAAPQAQTS